VGDVLLRGGTPGLNPAETDRRAQPVQTGEAFDGWFVVAETASPQVAADRWTVYSMTVWAICMLGFAFDICEATIMQLVTPLLIKEWGIAPATIGNITTVSRWVGLIRVLVFRTLVDLYCRRTILVLTILSYSLFTGLTGFGKGRCSC
jgi:hypothetical protein